MNVPVSVQMSRVNPGGNVRLVIQDGLSGLRILEATLTPEQFAGAVTALHVEGIPARLFDEGFDLLGRRREVRRVPVPEHVTDPHRADPHVARVAALRWATEYARDNAATFPPHVTIRLGHHYDRTDGHRVTFTTFSTQRGEHDG